MNENDVTIIIPIFNLDDSRKANLVFILNTLLKLGVKLLIVEQIKPEGKSCLKNMWSVDPPNLLFVECDSNFIHKSKLINMAVDRVDSEYVWIIDADCYLPYVDILSAPWDFDFIQPYTIAKRISEEDTVKIRSGLTVDVEFEKEVSTYYTYVTMFSALSFIARTSKFKEVGGFDSRFYGWGYEDFDFHIRVMQNEPDWKTDDIKFYFGYMPFKALHLWHPEDDRRVLKINQNEKYDNMDCVRRNHIVLNSKHTEEDKHLANMKYIAYISEKTINIVTLFRGNFQFLENIDNFLAMEIFSPSTSLTWVLNTKDEKFISEVYKRASKYKDVRIVFNDEYQLEITDHYYDSRHEFIGETYKNIIGTTQADYVITLEDDMIPPKNSLFKLTFDMITYNASNEPIESTLLTTKPMKVGAMAGVYKSKDVQDLACCVLKDCGKRYALDDIENLGMLEADNCGGGFTIWSGAALREIGPVRYIRKNENEIMGWDWYITNEMKTKDYKIFVNTDMICDHLV